MEDEQQPKTFSSTEQPITLGRVSSKTIAFLWYSAPGMYLKTCVILKIFNIAIIL